MKYLYIFFSVLFVFFLASEYICKSINRELETKSLFSFAFPFHLQQYFCWNLVSSFNRCVVDDGFLFSCSTEFVYQEEGKTIDSCSSQQLEKKHQLVVDQRYPELLFSAFPQKTASAISFYCFCLTLRPRRGVELNRTEAGALNLETSPSLRRRQEAGRGEERREEKKRK